jgi:hypothetical protein
LFAVACSGASSTLGDVHDSGTSTATDSGTTPGADSGGGPVDSGGGGDSSTVGPDGGGTCNPTLPDGGACNSLEPSGPLVPYQCIAATMPTPAGGTIVDGTYVLTSSAFYGSPCPAPEQDRDEWLICGTNWQTVQELTAGTNPAVLHTFDVDVTPAGGPALNVQITCGAPLSTITFQYTASPTTLTLFVGGGSAAGTGRVDTYERQ